MRLTNTCTACGKQVPVDNYKHEIACFTVGGIRVWLCKACMADMAGMTSEQKEETFEALRAKQEKKIAEAMQ